MFIFPLIATIVSFVFAFLVFRQYQERQKPYQLVWSVALVMFGLGALAETMATLQEWNEILVKTYYIFGGTLVVGYLGLGTVYLSEEKTARNLLFISVILTFLLWLMIYGIKMLREVSVGGIIIIALYLFFLLFLLVLPGRATSISLLFLLIASILAVVLILNAGIDPALLGETKGWQALKRSLAIKSSAFSLNVIGSFVLILGAIYSSWVMLRKKIMRKRAIANILIALGVLVVASGGTVGGLFGLGGQAAISVPMAIGVTIMFFGFLQASRPLVQVI